MKCHCFRTVERLIVQSHSKPSCIREYKYKCLGIICIYAADCETFKILDATS